MLPLIEPKESKFAIVAAPEPTTREIGRGYFLAARNVGSHLEETFPRGVPSWSV